MSLLQSDNTSIGLMSNLHNQYDSWMSMGDPRVENWPLMSSPWPTLSISLAYIIFAVFVPKILKGRKIPVFYLVIPYNFVLVIVNLYMVVELLYTTWHYNWKCCEVDYSNNEFALRTAKVLWLYYISKIVEMLDTVFFICKGNYHQLSFLHIYHHSTIFILWWLGVKFVPGGNAVPGAIINSSVHVIMYSYYFFAAFGPLFKKYLWWKRYITGIQLTQFAIALTQSISAYNTGCRWPNWMYIWFNGYQISFLFLFGNFYIVNYINKKPSIKQKKSE
jgi:elongation of very long chain fatty acids protein 4